MDLDSRALRIDSNEILSKALFRSMKMPIEGTFFDKLRCNSSLESKLGVRMTDV